MTITQLSNGTYYDTRKKQFVSKEVGQAAMRGGRGGGSKSAPKSKGASMSKKNSKSNGKRRSSAKVSLTAAIPTLKIGAELLGGREGVCRGLLNTYQDPKMAVLDMVDGLSVELSGYRPGVSDGARGWNFAPPVENLALGATAKVGAWAARKSGLGRTLKALNLPVTV